MKTKTFVSAALALSLTLIAQGCGSGRVIEKERIEKISRVAVVGFSIQERLPNSGKSVLKNMLSVDDDSSGGSVHAAEIAKVAPHADEGLRELKRTLEQRFRWKVVAGAELANSSAFQKFMAQKTRQPQRRPMLSGRNKAVFVPTHAVETFLLQDMTPAERGELARALGVDAVLLVNYEVDLVRGGGLKQLVGAGDFKSRAVVDLSLLAGAEEKPIWRDIVVGDTTSEKVEHALGFASEDATHAQALAAMRLATTELMSKIN